MFQYEIKILKNEENVADELGMKKITVKKLEGS